MRIQHNIAALNSYRNLGVNNSGVAKNLEKLSSGYRINRAGDDAAGLAISEKMRSQITGLNTATKNANDGISLVQTAEGALTEVHSMLNRMVEIATQSSNGVYEDGVDRAALQDEMDALTDEIDRISQGTNFNKRNLLDGTASNFKTLSINDGYDGTNAVVNLKLQFASKVGDKETSIVSVTFKAVDDEGDVNAKLNNNALTINLLKKENYSATDIKNLLNDLELEGDNTAENITAVKGANVVGLGVEMTEQVNAGGAGNANDLEDAIGTAMNLQIGDSSKDFNKLAVGIRKLDSAELGLANVKVDTEEDAGKAIDAINAAINLVSTQRGELGAVQNRLEHTINNLSVNAENMTAAESRIRDVDMADEIMKYTKNNILVQASQAMLAQANQVPQGVLQLLQ